LSGPLADRIDLHVRIGAVKLAALGELAREESSAQVAQRVVAARQRQAVRYAVLPGVRINAEVPGRWLQQHGLLTGEAKSLLSEAADRLRLSARAYHRALRVARTVADLDGAERVDAGAIAEAMLFRAGDSQATGA
jgi:magnesium chelatase family protein